ncbi:MAG TPA: ABC transporter permease [bacterium]|nr:ABC transporter permease [bacterium]
MPAYILTRLLLMVAPLLGVATIVFVVLRLIPGDIVLLRLAGEGGSVTEAVLRAERARLGLSQPLWQQYAGWIWGLVRGDLGLSMWTGRPVAYEIWVRLRLSLELTLVASALVAAIAIPLGSLAALRRGGWIDYVLRGFAVAGLSMPAFWVGVLVLLFLLVLFHWSPPVTFTPFWQNPVANLSLMVWPACVVAFRSVALSTRIMRSALLDVLHEDYVRTARAKGLPWGRIVMQHAVRNALLPVITIVSLEAAAILGGLVVTEQVFNLNGLGKLLVDAVTQRDYTLTQALIMLSATAFVLMNFFVDLCYAWLDPRIRYR